VAQKKKPNFTPQGNKKSGAQKDAISGVTKSKRQTTKTHHDGIKSNRRPR
jgi:hypothetical protein